MEWIQLEGKFEGVFAGVTLYVFKLLSYVSFHLFSPLLDEKTEGWDLKGRVHVHTREYHRSRNSNPDLFTVPHGPAPSPRIIMAPGELNKVTWIEAS